MGDALPVVQHQFMGDLADAVTLSDTDAYLVTGNIKHFPVKPYVVTPKEMLEILNENER